jgi:hypothetical protein
MENKKRQLYRLFRELDITEEQFKKCFNKWAKRFEDGGLETSPEDYLPKFSNKIEREADEYKKGEHTFREIYDYLTTLYTGVVLDKELAGEMALFELILSIMKTSELLYLMKSIVEKPKYKA